MNEPDRQRLLAAAKELPTGPGVYLMRDAAGTDIYVGKAKNLRRRVSSYFLDKRRTGKDAALLAAVQTFTHVETDSELEAYLLESRLIKDFQPKYNIMLKDKEGYPLLEVTWGEDFPRLRVAWRKEHEDSRYFGPYVGTGGIKGVIAALQRIFLFRACSRKLDAADARLRHGRGCLNLHLQRCSGPCCGRVDKEEYRQRMAALCRFLSGGKKDLIDDLRREMKEAAKELRFEEAARKRDLVQALETLHDHARLDASLQPLVPRLDPENGPKALAELLELPEPAHVIEGIDIANLMGKETVGSLVSFLDGQPCKERYRRFRIQSVDGQDDFASIAEVVRRRYGRLAAEGEAFPDVLLIDGGRGQLGAAAKALAEVGEWPKALVSLAKAEELVFVWGRDEPLRLAKRHPALRLLMHVRDETHRFAQHYHHILRRKAMFGP